MGGAGQDDELAVSVRQLVKEFLEVGDGGDAIIFSSPRHVPACSCLNEV